MLFNHEILHSGQINLVYDIFISDIDKTRVLSGDSLWMALKLFNVNDPRTNPLDI